MKMINIVLDSGGSVSVDEGGVVVSVGEKKVVRCVCLCLCV